MEYKYVKNEPYVGDDGIYMPVAEYSLEGTMPYYRIVVTKDLFVEAYNKWIKGHDDGETANDMPGVPDGYTFEVGM